jgi:hypothetical protein
VKLVRPVLAAALGVSLAVAGAAGAATPRLPACATFSDPTGDTALEGAIPVADASVDITGVKLGYAKKTFAAGVTVAKYAAASTYSDGVRFDVNFTAPDGKVVTLFGQHSRTEAVSSQAFAFSGIKVDGTYVSGSNKAVAVSTTGNTFTMTVGLADVEAALGGDKVAGKSVSNINAISWGGYEVVSLGYDNAAGTKPFKVLDCA